MRINTNISAMNAHRQLGINTNLGAKSMEKLSSGLRINRAGDDAAGLAISEKMRGQIRGLTQASRNAQDGISLIQTAEGALNETHSILQRMRELAVQSATDTNTQVDRAEIQKEVDQLAAEITRIADTTEFNTQKLLEGSFQAKIHIGANEGQNMDLTIGDMRADAMGVSGSGAGNANFQITASAGTTDDVSVDVLPDGDSTFKVVDFGENKVVCGEHNVRYGLENEDGEIVAVATKSAQNFAFLQEGVSLSNLELDGQLQNAAHLTGGTTAISFDEAVRSGEVVVKGAVDGAATDITATASVKIEGLATGTYTVVVEADTDDYQQYFEGITFDADATSDHFTGVLLNEDGQAVAVRLAVGVNGADGNQWFDVSSLDLEQAADAAGDFDNVAEADVVMTTDAGNLTGGETLVIRAEGGIDVSSQEAADKAITVLDAAIERVSAERSALGANQNRLEHTIANLGTSAENLAAAESRIRDVDMAAEMMEFTKQNILNQAATAMLAQANNVPSTVLQLLG